MGPVAPWKARTETTVGEKTREERQSQEMPSRRMWGVEREKKMDQYGRYLPQVRGNISYKGEARGVTNPCRPAVMCFTPSRSIPLSRSGIVCGESSIGLVGR